MKIILAATAFLSFIYLQDPDLQESMQRGQKIYDQICVTCHKPDGQGLLFLYPPLADSDFLLNKTEEAIKVVKNGIEGTLEVNGVIYNNMMPAQGLSDQEVADVLNYVLRSWGNQSKTIITTAQVEQVTSGIKP